MTFEKIHFNAAVAKTMTRKQFILHTKVATTGLTNDQLGEAWDLMTGGEKKVVTETDKKKVAEAVSNLVSTLPLNESKNDQAKEQPKNADNS